MQVRYIATLVLCVIVMVSGSLWAQDESELAKKTQTPVADLISVPLQSNFNFGTGSKEKMVYVLNVQPVIPISLTDDWNVITRIVTPMMVRVEKVSM